MILEAARHIVTAENLLEAKTVWVETIIGLMLQGLCSAPGKE
jgi:hypothetical protein